MVLVLKLWVDLAHVRLLEQLLALVGRDLRDVVFEVILALFIDCFDQLNRLLPPVVKCLLISLHGGTFLEHFLESRHLARVVLLLLDSLLDLDAIFEDLRFAGDLALGLGEHIRKLLLDRDLLRWFHSFSQLLPCRLSLHVRSDPFDPLLVRLYLLLSLLLEFL